MPGRWIKELIKKLLMISWDMWDHCQDSEVRKAQIVVQLIADIEEHHEQGSTNNSFLVPAIKHSFFHTMIKQIL